MNEIRLKECKIHFNNSNPDCDECIKNFKDWADVRGIKIVSDEEVFKK